ncbi:MAG: metallophosphoesterase [Halobacteria archaeon]
MTEDSDAGRFDDLSFGAGAVYLPEEDIASVSDLHVGLADAARRDGTALPFDEETALEEAVRDVLTRFEPSTLVFDGDVQHSFGGIGDAGETVRRLKRVVEADSAQPVFVEGNHDTDLSAVVETHAWYEEGDAVFVHGDTVPADLPDASLYVVGHDHPTVEIEGQKQACFLHGPYGDASVVMTPALNPLCEGVVVNEMRARDFMSPFVRDFDAFRVAVETGDDVLRFPRIKEFRRML